MKTVILKFWPVILLFILFLIFAASWILYLRHDHSTFDNYYQFRGCLDLVEKTDDYAICRIKNGTTIKIVKYEDRWFLDGDLPGGFLSF